MSAQDIAVTPDGRMSAADAARYLGLQGKTLAMHRIYGSGPRFAKIGRIWYFKQDLDDWIQARMVSTTAEYLAKQRTGEVETSQIPRAKVSRRTRKDTAPTRAKLKAKSAHRVASKGRRAHRVEA